MTTLQTLKGFRDFIGADARKRTWLMGVFREVFEAHGFEPLETPALEYEALLLGKYGDEANKLIYSFEDRGGRRVALRYDQTVPTARVVAQYQHELIFPYKRYQIQPVWRSDKPQRGRYREFTQCDIDIIGAPGAIADAQILTTVSAVFEKLGLDTVLKINDREQLISTIQSAGVAEDQVLSVIQTIDKLDKKPSSEVIAELRDKKLSQETCDILFTALQTAKPPQGLAEIMRTAVSLGVPESQMVFTPTLARGLDYYTGMIMEPVVSGYTAGSVGGGGRYDNLIGSLVGKQMPATGIAFGFDRILEALTQLDKFPASLDAHAQVLMTIFSQDSAMYSASIFRLLQKNHIVAELYSDPHKKLEAQIKYATAKHIPYVVIAGPEEQKGRVVILKNLKTREQITVDFAKLVEVLVRDKK
jgi:histidyl-tRNA synthetase